MGHARYSTEELSQIESTMLDRYICNNPKYFASSQGLGHCQNLELEKQDCLNNSKSLNSLRQIPIEGHYSRDTTPTSPVITTSVHFAQHLGNSESLSAAAPVRELVEPIPQAEDSTTSAQAFGTKCSDSSTSADRNSSSGRTSLLPEEPSQDNNTQSLEQFSGVLPTAGLMQNGRLFPQQNLECLTKENGCLLLPTPMAHSRASDKYRTPGQDKLEQTLRNRGIISKGQVSTPSLREWMMGLPSGYTDITEQDGGKPTHHTLQSAPLNEVSPIASAEYKPLETLAHHSKQQLYGNGSDTWQGSCQAGMRVWSKGTVTHHDEPATPSRNLSKFAEPSTERFVTLPMAIGGEVGPSTEDLLTLAGNTNTRSDLSSKPNPLPTDDPKYGSANLDKLLVPHETPALVDKAADIPAAEELAGSSSDHLNEVGSQTISQEVCDMAATGNDTSAAAVEVVEELTDEEASDRHRLELKVERAFREAGLALTQLRNRRLYRSTHSTFEAYCRDRFGMQRAYPYRLIDAAMVIDNLSPIGDILPTTESQCRPLARLKPDIQRQAWNEAVEASGGKVPTAKLIGI